MSLLFFFFFFRKKTKKKTRKDFSKPRQIYFLNNTDPLIWFVSWYLTKYWKGKVQQEYAHDRLHVSHLQM